jgi:hypothetical protein
MLTLVKVDQDTTDLKALAAVLAPKDVKAFLSQADNTAYWAVCSSRHILRDNGG